MSSVSQTEVFNCTVEQFYKIITDYNKYSEFLSEVKACHVVEDHGTKKLVEYQVSIIKTFTYSLWMHEKENQGINWEFAGGDLFKTSTGSWVLEDQAGKVRATYSVDVAFKTFVPGPVSKALVQVNLPNMMGSYHKRVSELYGG